MRPRPTDSGRRNVRKVRRRQIPERDGYPRRVNDSGISHIAVCENNPELSWPVIYILKAAINAGLVSSPR